MRWAGYILVFFLLLVLGITYVLALPRLARQVSEYLGYESRQIKWCDHRLRLGAALNLPRGRRRDKSSGSSLTPRVINELDAWIS